MTSQISKPSLFTPLSNVMLRQFIKHQRQLHSSPSPILSLFGSGRPIKHRPSPEQILRPPQNKSQAPANPADILKKMIY